MQLNMMRYESICLEFLVFKVPGEHPESEIVTQVASWQLGLPLTWAGMPVGLGSIPKNIQDSQRKLFRAPFLKLKRQYLHTPCAVTYWRIVQQI